MNTLPLSRTGLVLGVLYLAILAGCAIWAQFITDPKGKYLVLQLPVVLQHGLLLALDATWIVSDMSWPTLYLLLGTPMLVLLVLLGNTVEHLALKTARPKATE